MGWRLVGGYIMCVTLILLFDTHGKVMIEFFVGYTNTELGWSHLGGG